MTRLAVYCGSSPGADPAYAAAARALGTEMAARGIGLVFGGGHVGLMGAIADAVLEAGGEVIGVIPEALRDKELAHQGCTELHVVSTMHERKSLMADFAKGFIAMPGGFGTFDEMFEMLTWGQLGYHTRPCGFLNVAGYYDALFAFLDICVEARFVTRVHREMIITATEPGELLDGMAAFEPPDQAKWLDRFDL
jgi:uncharacterized protein (TIGR00730 family)